ADKLRALGHLDGEQLFNRQAKCVLLVHRRDIVEPVEIRHRLQVGLVLDQLFGAAMEQADMGVNALHHLAIEFEHEAKHTMRCGMLRSEVDGEIAQGSFGHQLTSSAAAFALSATLALKRSQLTTARS